MPAPNEITPKQLNRMIGTPDCPALIDICIDEDFCQDPRLIPGAQRHAFDRILELAPDLEGQRSVIICQKGLKLSQGAAALLRAKGVAAEYLEGGNFAWRDLGYPLVPAEKIPPLHDGRTLWVTRHRPKVDRVACPWLIRQFIDPGAAFLFVSPVEVLNVAERFGATPFDLPEVFWSHRGAHCTFDVMLEEFCLDTEPLKRLAGIVRGADTDRDDLAPEVAGLRAACLGLSRMFRDDLAQLEAGLTLFDAFYRWARDASGETHNWDPERGNG